MKIKSVKFKLTTNKKLKCNNCKKYVMGKEGFVHLVDKIDYGWGYERNMRIC